MIELRGITKTYRPESEKPGTVVSEVRALQDVSLRIESGEFVAIIGPSGSGKSTLLHVLGFLDRPDSGSYRFMGRETAQLSDDELAGMRNRVAGFVFQQFHLLARATAVQNVLLPMVYAGRGRHVEPALARLADVGLGSRADHKPNQLSGGEQQRVAIARALVSDPLIIFADEPTGNLDSRSESEIVAILENLNRQGKTVILVTHEKDLAARAGRVIQMRDGKVVADERRADFVRRETMDAEKNDDRNGTGPRWIRTTADFGDHLRQAFAAMMTHKMRSALSVLGVLIGVGAIIAMMAVTEGAKESLRERMAGLGSNLLIVRPGMWRFQGVAMQAGSVTRMTEADADAIREIPGVRRVGGSVRGGVQVVYGGKNWNSTAEGVGVDYAEMRAAVPQAGRFFTQDEMKRRDKVVVLGTTLVNELFGNENPMGKTVKINRINFTVIGILPSKGSDAFRDADDTLVVPLTTAMYRLLGRRYVDNIDVEVQTPEQINTVMDDIRELMVRRYRLAKSDENSITVRNMTEIQDALSATVRTMSWLLGSIAAISLIVGGIGIMNIMIVSVNERTREIGLRKAVGARRRDILTQFLIESVIMTVTGGLAGVLLGAGAAGILSRLAGWPVSVSITSVVLAVGFSAGIGIVFGLWPARLASRLDPIHALRYE